MTTADGRGSRFSGHGESIMMTAKTFSPRCSRHCATTCDKTPPKDQPVIQKIRGQKLYIQVWGHRNLPPRMNGPSIVVDIADAYR